MPFELPTLEEEYGVAFCVCGEPEATISVPSDQEHIAKYKTPQGDVFVRAGFRNKPKQNLYVNCAKPAFFERDRVPKVTTRRKEDVFRIMEYACDSNVRATVCGTFRVPLEKLPESGLIRSLLMESKAADTSIKMTSATFTIKGMPITTLKWRIRSATEGVDLVHIDLKGYGEFRISEKYLTNVWRWIYEKFALFVLGDKRASPSPSAE